MQGIIRNLYICTKYTEYSIQMFFSSFTGLNQAWIHIINQFAFKHLVIENRIKNE